VLHLPYPEEVDLEGLRIEFPSIARLWYFAGEVGSVAFHEKSPFSKSTAQQDWEFQIAGQAAIPELRSGNFDKGFYKTAGLRNDLKAYRGPYNASCSVRLENAKSYHFASYLEPVCPREVLAGLVWGYVQLLLTVDVKTGEVLQAVSQWAGDPLLIAASIEAARKWRFVPDSIKSAKLPIKLFFGADCS
jgi:hypothetical protein